MQRIAGRMQCLIRAAQTASTQRACGPATCGAWAFSTEAERSAEKLMELMTHSPAMQQMMLATLPPGLRASPEMIKTMLADPGVKRKLVEMISKQGMKLPTGILDKMNASHMDDTVARLSRAGINPMDIPQKLMAYPALFKQLQDPKYMQAFLETAETPAAASKYDAEVMEVVNKAQQILRGSATPQTTTSQEPQSVRDAEVLSYTASGPASTEALAQPPPPSTPPSIPPSTAASPTSPPRSMVSSGGGAAPAAPAAAAPPSQVPFMQLLMQDPALASKLANPRVQKALAEISKSPWKTIKYIFDRDVMQVFGALNQLLKTGVPKK